MVLLSNGLHPAPHPTAPVVVDSTSRPLFATDKNKEKENVIETRQRWTLVKRNQKRQDSKSDMATQYATHPTTQCVPSIG